MAGRPLGSKNKNEGRPYKAAMHRLSSKNPDLLDKLALALATKALEGDTAALREWADRMDGKVPQAVGQDNELGPIEVVITGVPRPGDPE